MATGWFICDYKRRDSGTPGQPGFIPGRYCAMDDFTLQISAQGGAWQEAECFGNKAVVKVIGVNEALLQTIDGASGFLRLTDATLDRDTTTLNNPQRTRLTNTLLSLGFTQAEINAAFPGGWATAGHTFREILNFSLSRRLQVRYDAATNTIICDGPAETTATVEIIEQILPGAPN